MRTMCIKQIPNGSTYLICHEIVLFLFNLIFRYTGNFKITGLFGRQDKNGGDGNTKYCDMYRDVWQP